MALCVLMKFLEDADLPLLTNRELTDEVQQQGMTSSPGAEVIEIPCKDNALQNLGNLKGVQVAVVLMACTMQDSTNTLWASLKGLKDNKSILTL